MALFEKQGEFTVVIYYCKKCTFIVQAMAFAKCANNSVGIFYHSIYSLLLPQRSKYTHSTHALYKVKLAYL